MDPMSPPPRLPDCVTVWWKLGWDITETDVEHLSNVLIAIFSINFRRFYVTDISWPPVLLSLYHFSKTIKHCEISETPVANVESYRSRAQAEEAARWACLLGSEAGGLFVFSELLYFRFRVCVVQSSPELSAALLLHYSTITTTAGSFLGLRIIKDP